MALVLQKRFDDISVTNVFYEGFVLVSGKKMIDGSVWEMFFVASRKATKKVKKAYERRETLKREEQIEAEKKRKRFSLSWGLGGI